MEDKLMLEKELRTYLYRNMPDREQMDGETGDQLCDEKECIAKDVAYDVTKIFTTHIISIIDETIKRKVPEEYMSDFISGYHKALTELKQKIEAL